MGELNIARRERWVAVAARFVRCRATASGASVLPPLIARENLRVAGSVEALRVDGVECCETGVAALKPGAEEMRVLSGKLCTAEKRRHTTLIESFRGCRCLSSSPSRRPGVVLVVVVHAERPRTLTLHSHDFALGEHPRRP